MHEVLSMIASMFMSIYMLGLYSNVHEQGQNRVVYAAAASQFQSLLDATKTYVDVNSAQLLSAVPVGSITQLGLPALIAANDLTPNFTTTNPFGQYWQIFLTQPQAGHIEAYVESAGGTQLGLSALTSVVGMAGGQSGFVPPDGVMASLNSGTAIGNMGKWRLPLAGLPNPGGGHFYGIATASAGAQYNSDVLYRANVPGHPELNTMSAPLGMNGNDINAIGNAQVNNNLSVGDQITAQGAKLAAGNNLQIGTASVYGDNQNAAIRSPGKTYIQHQDGSLAPLVASTVSAASGVQYSPTAALGASCDQSGLTTGSNDGSGDVLACVNGIWKSITSKPINTYVPPTSNGFGGYAHPNPVTGGYSCEAGTYDNPAVTLWYGDYGYSGLHVCEPQ